MKAQITGLIEKIDNLNVRERAMLLLVILVAIIFLWNEFLMVPFEKTRKKIEASVTDLKKSNQALDLQIKVISQTSRIDPDKENLAQLRQLNSTLEQLDKQLSGLMTTLIPPKKMTAALEDILSKNGQLKLLRVESLSVKPLLEESKDKEKGASGIHQGVFRHAMAIEFEGSYSQTVKYLKALEQLPWLFFWDKIDYHVEEYPKAKVTIIVSTLSLNERWIGV
jgi:MSHA biogenesis protein MshJ